MTFKIACKGCGEIFPITVTFKQLHDWEQGGLIQEVMPHLTADERELIKTRTCGKCWDKIFADKD